MARWTCSSSSTSPASRRGCSRTCSSSGAPDPPGRARRRRALPDWRGLRRNRRHGWADVANDGDKFPWLPTRSARSQRRRGRGRRSGASASACNFWRRASARACMRGPEPEVGLLRSRSRRRTARSGVRECPDDLLTLQWHGDTFDLPDGASGSPGSPAYANQASASSARTASSSTSRSRPRWRRSGREVPAYAEVAQ